MNNSVSETDTELKQTEMILNYFKEYERNKVRKELLQEYRDILEKEKEIARKDEEFMKRVHKRLEECCQVGILSTEVQKMNEKLLETQKSIREVNKKINDLKTEHNTTQQNIQMAYFQNQKQIIALHEAELQHLTEKLQNNRIAFEGKLQELRDKIDLERATKDMQYENVKNEKQKQLMSSHQCLGKLQNEQKELKMELHNIKEEQRKSSRTASLTSTPMNFNTPFLQQSTSSTVQHKINSFGPCPSTITSTETNFGNSYTQSSTARDILFNVPGYRVDPNNFQTDDFDLFEKSMVSNSAYDMFAPNYVLNKPNKNEEQPREQQKPQDFFGSPNLVSSAKNQQLTMRPTEQHIKPTGSVNMKVDSSHKIQFVQISNMPISRPSSAGPLVRNAPTLYGCDKKKRFYK